MLKIGNATIIPIKFKIETARTSKFIPFSNSLLYLTYSHISIKFESTDIIKTIIEIIPILFKTTQSKGSVEFILY
jgi:hypothetical protein